MSGRLTQQYVEAASSGDGTQAGRLTQQYIEVAAAPVIKYVPTVAPAYSAASKQATQGKREPVIIVRVEDVATLSQAYTTKIHWDGSVVKTGLSTTQEEGNILPDVEISAFTYAGFSKTFTFSGTGATSAIKQALKFSAPAFATFPYSLTALEIVGIVESSGGGVTPEEIRNIHFEVRSGSATGTVVASSLVYGVSFVPIGVAEGSLSYTVRKAVLPTINFGPQAADLDASTDYYLVWSSTNANSQTTYPGPTTDWYYGFYRKTPQILHLNPTNAVNATMTTSTIDLGLTPLVAATFNVDDIKPSGASIAYTAYADDFDPPTTSRGVVEDGDAIGAAGYRYYRLKADFATTNGNRGVLSEIRITGGDSQFKFFSTHKDVPSVGYLPLLPSNPVGTLSSKIEIDKPTSVGELSFKMLWTKVTGDMLATGFLRNKAIQILHGFVGLSISDYQTIFTGTWANYTADANKRIISVSTQNVLKKFMKVKLPRETFNAVTGVKETTALVWAGVNAVQAILDLIEELGIPDRYLDRTTIEGLRDGALSSVNYNVTRTITDPQEAWKLIHELATLCGCFVVVLPTGKMTLVLYDAAATPVATLDARFVDFGVINGGQDQLFTRQLIYYAPNVADPGDDAKQYDKGLLAINATSETAYDESTEHRWFDKWGASATVITALATRWDGWQGTPRFTLPAKKVPNHLLDVLEGQVVWVTGLKVPTAAADFDTPQKFKALVMKRSFNPTSCTLDFDLMQIADAVAA